MSAQSAPSTATAEVPHESWVPMIAIALGQMIMSFNVASLPVAMSGMVNSFGVPPTTVATGIVAYSMLVAGFVMLGAKLIQRYGALRVFRIAVLLFCASQVLMTLSPTAGLMITAQALCGASAAVIVPSLVALIAENYRGQQQATAIGALGSARAAAGVLAFTIGGIVGTNFGWRPSFGILVAVSALVFLLSFRLKPDKGRPEVQIDFVGVILAAAAMILISFGFNNLNRWGLVFARPGAPFDLLGVSPAPVMILVGIVLGQTFRDVDAAAPGSGKNAAACARGDRLVARARRGLCDVLGRRARGHAQFFRAALYPDRARPLAARNRHRHDAVQPDGILHRDADREALHQADPAADRALRLRYLHGGAVVACLRGAQ